MANKTTAHIMGYSSAPAAPVSPKPRTSASRAAEPAGQEWSGPCSTAQQQLGAVSARPLKVDLSGCKYELLRHVAARLHWQLVPAGSADWDLCWLDTSVSQERLLKLEPAQRINHFFGMLELARKRAMARTLSALSDAAANTQHSAAAHTPPTAPPTPAGAGSRIGPAASQLLDFLPRTWLLPQELPAFLAAAHAGGRKAAFIVKPDAGCQGRGICLVLGGPQPSVLQAMGGTAAVEAVPAVAQQYLHNPLLVNELKFDLRVYCLITSAEPLRVFLYKEGLVRFCTTPYKRPSSKNLGCSFMHLTNYAVNKHNTDAFIAPTAAAGTAAAAAAVAATAAAATAAPGGGRDEHRSSNSSDGSGGWHPEEQQQQEEEDTGLSASAAGGDASKWSFQQLRLHLEGQGADWPLLWSRISQLVTKSLIAVTPHLTACYKTAVINSSSSSTSGSSLAAAAAAAAAAAGPAASDVAAAHSSKRLFASQRRSSSSSDGGSAAAAPTSSFATSNSSSSRRRKQKGLSPAAMAAAHGCRCFEVLGFDVLIDAELKPWLIEVNHSPSFNIDSPLDRTIKEALILDTIKLVRVDPKAIAAAKRAAHRATQARLLTYTHCRQGCNSSSTAGGSSGGGCDGSNAGSSAAVLLEAQQAERAAFIASMDAWQGKHLGGFERAYPLLTPDAAAAAPTAATSPYHSTSSSGRAACGSNTAQQQQQWREYAVEQQEAYDQLLLLSQRVYTQQREQQQQQQHGSPVKHQQQQQKQQHGSPQQLLQNQQQSRRALQRSVSHPVHRDHQQQQQQQVRAASPLLSSAATYPQQQEGEHGQGQQQLRMCAPLLLAAPSEQQQQQVRGLQKSLTSPSRLQRTSVQQKQQISATAGTAVLPAGKSSPCSSSSKATAAAFTHAAPSGIGGTAAGEGASSSPPQLSHNIPALAVQQHHGSGHAPAGSSMVSLLGGWVSSSPQTADAALASLRDVLTTDRDPQGGSSSSSSRPGSARLDASQPGCSKSGGSTAAGSTGCSDSGAAASRPSSGRGSGPSGCCCRVGTGGGVSGGGQVSLLPSNRSLASGSSGSSDGSNGSHHEAVLRSGGSSNRSGSGRSSCTRGSVQTDHQPLAPCSSSSSSSAASGQQQRVVSSSGSSSSSRGSSQQQKPCSSKACRSGGGQVRAHAAALAGPPELAGKTKSLQRQLCRNTTWPASSTAASTHNSSSSSSHFRAAFGGSKPGSSPSSTAGQLHPSGAAPGQLQQHRQQQQSLQPTGVSSSTHFLLPAGFTQNRSQYLPQLGQSTRLLRRINTTRGLLGQLDLSRVLEMQGSSG